MPAKLIFTTLLLHLTIAAARLEAREDQIEISNSGYAFLESGQFVKSHWRGNDSRYTWRQRAYLNFLSDIKANEKLDLHFGLEGVMWFNTWPHDQIADNRNFNEKHVGYNIREANGVYRFTETLNLTSGIFIYKYNENSKNLGEYMYRSGAYPNYILGDFDWNWATLSGFKLSHIFRQNWNNELLMTIETDRMPLFDWSLGYFSGYDIGKFLNIKGGIAFTNFLQSNKKRTTPDDPFKDRKNMILDTIGVDALGIPLLDTSYYTFQSTKLIFSFNFDLKPLIGWEEKGDDLELYGELAVLGWKNYQAKLDTGAYSFYENRRERMPVMIGINIPTFGIFDVLALEVEHYALKGPNSYKERHEPPWLPLPQLAGDAYTSSSDYTDADYTRDDFKWSLYARKTITPGWQIVGQVANDHVRHYSDSPIMNDEEEILTRPGQWWWALKLAFYY